MDSMDSSISVTFFLHPRSGPLGDFFPFQGLLQREVSPLGPGDRVSEISGPQTVEGKKKTICCRAFGHLAWAVGDFFF